MKLKFRLLALMLVFVLLMPMIVACSDPAIENTPAADKTPVAGELAALPEDAEKVDAKEVLIEALRNAEIDANKATITAKFKGDITVSFLDPDTTYSTSDIVDYVDDEGYITIPTEMVMSMLMGDSVVAEDFVAIYKQMLIDTFTKGDLADLETMLNGFVENFDIDSIVAKYTDAKYLSAYVSVAAIGSVIIANEYFAHMSADQVESFEDCARNIATSMAELLELILTHFEGEADLADVLDSIYTMDLLTYLYRGSECGINGEWNDTYAYVDTIIGNLARAMFDYEAVYTEGDYNLEVYYPAFSESSFDIIYLLIGRYAYDNYIFIDSEYVVDAVNEYLGSENGPFADFNLANVMIAYGCAALATIYSNEMIYDYANNYTEYEVAYFNLGTETWWMNSDDGVVEIDADDVYIIGDVYGDYKYAIKYGDYIRDGYTYYSALDYSGADYAYRAYRVSIGAEHVDLDVTVSAAFDEMFALFVSGINSEMDESDSVMAVAAITSFMLSYVGEYDDSDSIIPQSFAEKMIISLLNGTVIEGADEAIANVAALIGIKDEDDTDDIDPVQDFVDEWINTVEIIEGDLNAEQIVLALVIEALGDLEVELDDYYAAEGFCQYLACYIAAKYLGYDFIYEGEDLTDGIPAIVAAVMLEEWAMDNSEYYYERGQIVVFLNEYYEGEMDQIVNYEDILAIALLINSGSLESLVNYEYPFDVIEHMCMNLAFQSYAYDKFCAPYVDDENFDMYLEQYEQATRMLSMLAAEIYIEDAGIPAATAVSAALMVFSTDTLTPENSEFFQMLAAIANEAIENDGFDPITYPIENVIGAYIIPALFVDLGDGTRLIDVACSNYVATPDGAVAMGDIIEAIYLDSLTGFEATNGFDAEFYATLLTNVSIALDANGYPTDAIDNILASLALVEGDLDLEVLLDVALPELFGNEAYAALTDVIVALSAEVVDTTAAIAAIDAAIEALAEVDVVAVGYLRAVKSLLLAAEDTNDAAAELDPELTADEINAIMQQALIDALVSRAPTNEGIANYVALMYFADTYEIDVTSYALSVLYMTEDEFNAMFEEITDVLAVRAWALKYIELYNADAEIDAIEFAVDYLLAAGYYDEEDIPAENDPDFYEKLAVIYTANEIFCFDGYADVVVDIVFNPENIYLHGDALLELADSIIPENNALFVVKSAFYLLSTVAYLGVEDASTVDWDAALAYIPEYYAMLTGEELEIANNEALADMLRATFAEAVNTAITTTVVPYQTPTETLYIVTIVGDLDHSAINGSFEIVIEICISNEDIVLG